MKKIAIFVLLTLFVGGFLVAVGCAPRQDQVAETQKVEKSAQHYTCPMHPEVHENQPGSCPFCQMKLVPVK